ncbi:adenine deaminase [Raineyella fluvialis]|uniref:Adenine deaminase n=1 Tax=Raineyella fluvialis TaxID=2662261 RepID=A0A5Q2FBJ3_9ACTN|nr:adenine deaminase [Raineyella fluvialis]QGF23097.1 adenine deaminase [Raineyella fluvialis]
MREGSGREGSGRDGSGSVRANVVDIEGRRIRLADVEWSAGVITAITELGPETAGFGYLIPGFVDAHVHIESSLLAPTEFARMAVRHGTVASVSDPHEIANVLGVDGVRWMIDNAAATPFRVLFGAPSCVPATTFETAGARIGPEEVDALLALPDVGYLSEMMDFPGVLSGDAAVGAKIDAALRRGYPVDGHAPGVLGDQARAYAEAGISTDHECATLEEAEDKVAAGMLILIREGSAARNFEALHPLLDSHPGRIMLCSDDLHPSELMHGQIDRLVARAVAYGHDVFTVLAAACLTPQDHYGLDLGRLRLGDPFTAVLLDDLRDFRVRRTWIDGRRAAEDGTSLLPRLTAEPLNAFAAAPVRPQDLAVPGPAAAGSVGCRVITVTDGDLLTGSVLVDLPVRDGIVQPDPADDVLLITVVNRYRPAPPAVAFIRGFGFVRGAIASSVAHDSHNVIGVGTDAASLARAVNAVIEHRGGFAVADDETVEVLPLPIAGLMSDRPAEEVARSYQGLLSRVRTGLGSPLQAPFGTLSFMGLLVVPSLKVSDRGLFDGERFAFTEVVQPG